MPISVAVAGASGLVGREIVSLLAERSFPVGDLKLYASERSEGEDVELGERPERVERLPAVLPEVDVAFVCLPAAVAGEVVTAWSAAGSIVIDLSGSQGPASVVPLVLGEARQTELARRIEKGGVLALPSPLSRLVALPVAVLAELAPVRRVVATLLASASTFGSEAVTQLSRETVALLSSQESDSESASRALAFSCALEEESGAGSLTERVRQEIARLAGVDGPVLVTLARTPTFHAQAASVAIETVRPIAPEAAARALREAPSLMLAEPGTLAASTLDSIGSDAVHLGGLTADGADPNWIRFWAAADNVRQGGALAAVSLAETALRIRSSH